MDFRWRIYRISILIQSSFENMVLNVYVLLSRYVSGIKGQVLK